MNRKLTMTGEGEVENRPGRRSRRRERSWLRMGDKLSLSRCVCVHRRKLLAPADALAEGLVIQSPTRGLLGWDEEQRERCVWGLWTR